VKVSSETVPEPREFLFALTGLARKTLRTWISEWKNDLHFGALREKGLKALEKGEEEIVKTLTSLLGNRIFTIQDTFKEERQAIFRELIREEMNEHRRAYAELFDRTKEAVEALVKEGLEIPYEIRVAAEVTLSDRLLCEAEKLKRDYKGTLERGEMERIVREAREHGFHLQMEEPCLILNEMLNEKMRALLEIMAQHHPPFPEGDRLKEEKVEEITGFLGLAEKWGFELRKGEAQNLMDEMLNEYVWALEESWWGGGGEKPFPPNLIDLAEILGFNVDRFAKLKPVK